jgi:hypothetical protein
MAFSCEGAQHCFPCTCRTDRFPRFFRGEPRATETLDKAALKTLRRDTGRRSLLCLFHKWVSCNCLLLKTTFFLMSAIKIRNFKIIRMPEACLSVTSLRGAPYCMNR